MQTNNEDVRMSHIYIYKKTCGNAKQKGKASAASKLTWH